MPVLSTYHKGKFGTGYRKKDTSAPQRKREGLRADNHSPHNGNPYGGKALRKGRYRLEVRIRGNNDANTKRPDRIRSTSAETPWGSYGFTKPGSMK